MRFFLGSRAYSCRLFLVLMLWCVPAATLPAQPPELLGAKEPSGTIANGVGMTLPPDMDPELESLRTRVEASSLSDEEKQPIYESIGKSAKLRADKTSSIQATQQAQAALSTVADRVASVKAAIAALAESKPAEPEGTLSELETQLAALTAQRAAAKQALDNAKAAISLATHQGAEIDAELPKLNQTLERLVAQASATETEADASLKSEAMIAELESSAVLVKTQILEKQNRKALLEAEAAANLPQLSLDRLSKELQAIETRYESLKSAVESKRAEDANDRAAKADRQVEELHPALQAIGKENQRLASVAQELVPKIETAEARLKNSTVELERLRKSRDEAIRRVDQVGQTAAVSAMLRNMKQELPNVNSYRLKIRQRVTDIDDANYDLMDMKDARNGSLQLQIAELFRNSGDMVKADQRKKLEQDALNLLEDQRTEYLDPVISSQSKYFNTLVNISLTESEIVQLSETSRRYINENVLWTRSTQPLISQFVPAKSERWFTYRSAWTEVGPRLIADIKHRPFSWFAAFLSIAILTASRYRLRERITEIGVQTSQSKFVGFLPTMHALLLTIAAASPIPVLFWFLAERVASIAGDDRTMIALAVAARIFGSAYMMLELIRQIFRTKGLAECHLEWPQHTLVTVRRKLRMLQYAAVPLLTFASFLSAGAQGYGNDVLERYFFFGSLAVLCVFIVQTLHPRRGAPARFLATHPNGWANRLSSVWYPTMIAVPVLLGLLSVIGYHFTSWQLGLRFLQSVALLFVIGIAISLTMRWSIIHRRKLRIEQLRQQRASADLENTKGDAELPITLTDENSDQELREQMRQSRSLFVTAMVACAMAGLWIVWSDVLPALDKLDKWPAWRSTTSVTEWIKNDEGNEVASTYEVPDPVTYAEIVFALIILGIAFGATRNLPGLLEFAVLRRLPLDRSARYAITTLVRYAIILLGIIIAGSTIGLHWNQIQWMATALTFGLAFGLQEMFANFVAGIIILFEQPVRVGDAVQIDGVTGIVSKIRMRATTITDWDRKDYIVPNKEFITGKLLNWTRSDEIVRLTIPVGIAYGSNTKLAREILLEAAREHEDVLSDPPVLATFERFGESSLDFSLRVFVRTYERRLHICNDLHMAIDQKFREAKIEISFPQRDLHLRSFPQEMIKIPRAPRGNAFDDASQTIPHSVNEN